MRKKFCEYIGQYIFCRNIAKLHLTILDIFANEVIIDVDMFSIRISNRIMSKSYTVLIISIYNSSSV